jgi:hypothetical protein
VGSASTTLSAAVVEAVDKLEVGDGVGEIVVVLVRRDGGRDSGGKIWRWWVVVRCRDGGGE